MVSERKPNYHLLMGYFDPNLDQTVTLRPVLTIGSNRAMKTQASRRIFSRAGSGVCLPLVYAEALGDKRLTWTINSSGKKKDTLPGYRLEPLEDADHNASFFSFVFRRWSVCE